MLNCTNCGWQGINLVPKPKTDQAVCPVCGTIFQGIPAKNAALVSAAKEQIAIADTNAILALAETLFPGKQL